MRIKELQMKNFGKFHNHTVTFTEGMQVVYGENESGKSTTHAFLKAMLFGMERGRGRAAASDEFSRYEPWENPNFYSGSLRFESGGRNFLLERNFDKYQKSVSLICEDDGEVLSVEDGDLDMLLSGMGQSSYENTIAVGQLRAKPGESLSGELKNYATNYYATGNSDLNLEKALALLKERKKEIDRQIKSEISKKQKDREKIEQETSYIWRDIHKLQDQIADVQDELEEVAEEEEEYQKELEKQQMENPMKHYRVNPFIIGIVLIGMILGVILIPRPWNYLSAIVVFLAGGLYVWNRLKEGIRKKKPSPEEEAVLKAFAEEEPNAEKLRWEEAHLKEELQEKEVEYSNIQERLEELEEVTDTEKLLDKKREAADIAWDRLQELSGDMQKELERKMNAIASQILEAITDGRYTNLYIDPQLDMHLMADGRRIAIEQVSQGTIEQIYFALRMAASEVLYDEKFPVILDDAFAYYDEERLMRTMKWLKENRGQVIIFSCHKREGDLLAGL